MILEPINDVQCLGQLTRYARELVGTSLVRAVAMHLGSLEAVVQWLQSLPQEDDFGDEKVQVIQCDVPQRVRLFPDAPNCVERSLAAAVVREVLDPTTPRALATVDRPLRHTGLVEYVVVPELVAANDNHPAANDNRRPVAANDNRRPIQRRWKAVDLFPRRDAVGTRNLDFKSILGGAEQYVVRPVAKAYFGDAGARVVDYGIAQQNKLLGINKANGPEKQLTPPSGAAQRPGPAAPQPGAQPAALDARAQPAPTPRAGASDNEGSGDDYGQTYQTARGAAGFADGGDIPDACAQTEADAEGGDRDPYDARTYAQRFWLALGR